MTTPERCATARLVLLVLLAGLSRPAAGEEMRPAAGDARQPLVSQLSPRGSVFVFGTDGAHFEGSFGGAGDVAFGTVTARCRWLSRRFEWRLSAPAVNLRSDEPVTIVGGEPVPNTGGRTSETGAGDLLAAGQVWAVRGTAKRPWVAFLAEVKVPTADEDKGLGTGEVDIRYGIRLVQNIGRTSLFADASYTRMGDPDEIDLENVVRAGVGVAHPLGERHQFFALLENRTHPAPDRDDRIQLLIGDTARLGASRRIRLSTTILVGLSDTAADWGFVIGLERRFGEQPPS